MTDRKLIVEPKPTRPMRIGIDNAEAEAALLAIFADPGLCAEADKFFLGEDAPYEASGLFGYFFVVPSCTADEAHGQHAAFRRRNDAERLAVIRAPQDYGLVLRRGHARAFNAFGSPQNVTLLPGSKLVLLRMQDSEVGWYAEAELAQEAAQLLETPDPWEGR